MEDAHTKAGLNWRGREEAAGLIRERQGNMTPRERSESPERI